MLTLAAFRTAYPEFAEASDALVTSKLTDAEANIDPAVWLHRENEGHGLLTAHLLSTSPNGQFARLVSDANESTYGDRYQELVLEVSTAIRIFR